MSPLMTNQGCGRIKPCACRKCIPRPRERKRRGAVWDIPILLTHDDLMNELITFKLSTLKPVTPK